MNCPDFRVWSAEELAEGLDEARAAQVRQHLADCASCRAAHAQLGATLALLERVPAAPVEVDPRRVMAESLRRSERSRARWRRLGMAAAAASILLAVFASAGLRLEFHPGSVVVAWRSPDRPAATAHTDVPSDLAARLQRLDEIARLLADELEDQDFRQRRDFALLLGQIRQLQNSQQTDYALLERDVQAIYSSLQLTSSKTGEKP